MRPPSIQTPASSGSSVLERNATGAKRPITREKAGRRAPASAKAAQQSRLWLRSQAVAWLMNEFHSPIFSFT